MAQVLEFSKQAYNKDAIILNDREYEVYPVNGRWMWRTGKWWDWSFRKSGSFGSYVEALQDAMRDVRANG